MIHLIFYFTDINECNINNGDCEHTCTNTDGTFSCSCITGYELDSNGFNCSGNHFGEDYKGRVWRIEWERTGRMGESAWRRKEERLGNMGEE